MGYINLKYSELGSVHITPEICQLKVRIVMIVAINVDLIPTLHYRLRAIRGGPLGVVNFTSNFIVIQIFQILFLLPVSFYTHPNISLISLMQVRRMFTRADKDGDGKLTKEEWLSVLNSSGVPTTR